MCVLILNKDNDSKVAIGIVLVVLIVLLILAVLAVIIGYVYQLLAKTSQLKDRAQRKPAQPGIASSMIDKEASPPESDKSSAPPPKPQ